MNPASRHYGSWTEPGYFRTLFYILSVVVIAVMGSLSPDYGQTGDEWLQLEYGRHIWNYFVHGDPRALNYDDMSLQYLGQQFYGGLFDFGTEILHQWFPAIPHLTLRHFVNALMGAVMMIFTGLLARRISGRWSIGLLALLFMVFSPRIFGESMNNPKDIPFATGFIMGIYGLLALVQEVKTRRLWRAALWVTLGFGIAFGVRSAGGLLFGGYVGVFLVLRYLLNKEWRADIGDQSYIWTKKLSWALVLSLVLGYIIGLLAWPWGLASPIANPLQSLSEMTNRETQIRVLFEGAYRMNYAMPWYYEFKWMVITNPLIVILGILGFFVLWMPAARRYGWDMTLFVVFAAFFPLFYMIYKNSSVYDSWRHVFFLYPFWVIMASLAVDLILDRLPQGRAPYLAWALAVLALLPEIFWTIRSHPNQYVYFNALQGGVKGAYGQYDLDYYQNTGKQAADWIRENVEPLPDRKIILLSNMMGFDKYFLPDTAWIEYRYGRYANRHHLEWDYYVSNPRYLPAVQMQQRIWPPPNTIHTIDVDGVPLAAIMENSTQAGIQAKAAFDSSQYGAAAAHYAQYLDMDPTDEQAWINYAICLASVGQGQQAIEAVNQACLLDDRRPDFYEILAQIHSIRGDAAAAQQARNKVWEINQILEESMTPPGRGKRP